MSRDISDISNPALRRLTIIVGFIQYLIILAAIEAIASIDETVRFVCNGARKAW